VSRSDNRFCESVNLRSY